MANRFMECSVEGCAANAHWEAKGVRGLCANHNYRLQKHGDPLGGRTVQGVPKAYLRAYLDNPELTDDCVFWPYARNSAGYGHLLMDGGNRLVHREVCSTFNGPPPDAQPYAAHSCGNGHLGCMNYRHLRWASPSENRKDAAEHGTAIIGEATHMAKLTDEKVRAIRARAASGESQRCLASAFNVTQSNISYLLRGATWKHVQ